MTTEQQGHASDRSLIAGLERRVAADRETIADGLETEREGARREQAGAQRERDAADRERLLTIDVERLEAAAKVDQALIAHLEAEGEIERRRSENLEIALVSARRIGAAMGVLMSRHNVTDAAAFDLLKEASQRLHRKLRDVSEDVMLTGGLPDVAHVHRP